MNELQREYLSNKLLDYKNDLKIGVCYNLCYSAELANRLWSIEVKYLKATIKELRRVLK